MLTTRNIRSARAGSLVGSALLALAAAAPAGAQDKAPAGEDDSAISEIIVTAERRAQSSQDVPLALTTITGEAIAPGGITNVGDIAAVTPNLTVTQFNIGEPQFSLRGIGSTLDSAAADPTVSVFLDEVYMGRSGGSAFDLYDLDRIEVLRGPQGTLYGRNVTGGAISVYSKRPSDNFEGKVGLTVGNYGLTVLRGYVTGPLADGINGKLSISRLDRDGYSRNVLLQRDADDANTFSVRAQLLAKVSDRTEAILTGDFSRDRNAGDCRYVGKLDAAGQAFNGLYAPAIAAQQAQLGITNARQCAVSLEGFARRNMGGVSLRITHDMDWAKLTSITAYRGTKYAWFQELGGMDVPPAFVSVEDNEGETSAQWTQEIRLNGAAMADRLNWVVGLYGLHDHVDRFANVPIRSGPPSPFNTNVFLDRHWLQDATSKSAAVFGQATWEFIDGFSLTLGGRYTYDKKIIDQFYRQGATTVYDLKDLSKSWTRFTGRVTLDWKISRDIMAYATFSQGYKSGVFISQSTSGPAAATPLEPEDARNWEAGIKSQFLDRHVQLNVSVFDLSVKNLQLFRLVGLTLFSENSDARVKGLEADLQVVPMRGLHVGGSLSLLDPKYRGGTFDGKLLARAPKWKYSLDGSYSFDLGDDAEMTAGVSFSRSGDYFMEATNLEVSRVKAYGYLDASLKYTSADDRWDIALWGKNLTNELVVKHSIIGTAGGSVELYAPPRTYGVTANLRF